MVKMRDTFLSLLNILLIKKNQTSLLSPEDGQDNTPMQTHTHTTVDTIKEQLFL